MQPAIWWNRVGTGKRGLKDNSYRRGDYYESSHVREKKIISGALALLAVTSLLLSGCGKGSQASKSKAQKESKLVIAQISDAISLDPLINNEGPTNSINYNIYDGLIFQKADMTTEPALAESWEQKDDLTWIFHLRKNVKFHNGDPFTADDVLYSFKEVAACKVTNDWVSFIDTAKKLDDHTIEIKTKAPYAIILTTLSHVMIVDKKYCEKVGPEQRNLKPIGTGPYKVDEWVKEDHIKMTANEDYWRGKPEIKHVVFRPISNDATRVAALMSGEVQLITNVPVHDSEQIKKNPKLKYISTPGTRLIYLTLDVTREKTPTIEGKNPFLNPKVKEALQMAIDKEAIVKNIMNGHATVTNQGGSDKIGGYVADLQTPKYDPEKAKQLMVEAGYPDGFSVVLDAPNNRYPNDFKVAEAVAAQLAKINVKVKLNLMPKSLFFNYIRPGDKTSFLLTGFGFGTGDVGGWYRSMFYTRGKKLGYGGSNRGHYSNLEFDKYQDMADSTSSLKDRIKYLQECTRIATKDVPFIPLYLQENSYGTTSDIEFTPRMTEEICAYNIHFKK